MNRIKFTWVYIATEIYQVFKARCTEAKCCPRPVFIMAPHFCVCVCVCACVKYIDERPFMVLISIWKTTNSKITSIKGYHILIFQAFVDPKLLVLLHSFVFNWIKEQIGEVISCHIRSQITFDELQSQKKFWASKITVEKPQYLALFLEPLTDKSISATRQPMIWSSWSSHVSVSILLLKQS